MAFKIKTNNGKKYHATPSSGIVESGEEFVLAFTMLAAAQPPPEWGVTQDKFVVQAVDAPEGAVRATSELFSDASKVQ